MNYPKLTLDFETQSRNNLKKCGAYEYSRCPSTIIMCLGFKLTHETPRLLKQEDMAKPFKSLWKRIRFDWQDAIDNPHILFNAHNAFFEQAIYNNVLVARLGWPEIPAEKWRCTAAKAAAVAIPRALGNAALVMNLDVQKDFEGHRVMMKLCKPTSAHTKWRKQYEKMFNRGAMVKALEELKAQEPVEFWTPETAPDDYETLYKYCIKDVVTEEALDDALPDLTPTEQKLWFVDQKINFRGVQVDMPLIKKISTVMAAEKKSMNKELDTLTMGLVSSGHARNAILDFLTLEGLELPDLKSKTVDDFLENGKATGDAKKLLELRKALSKASTAKYQKFIEQAAYDGRVRDLLLYHGASTGRWGGKGIQPQNFPRGIVKDISEAIYRIKREHLDDLKMLYGENLMPLFSSVLRGMFVASPGKLLFVEDLNAIECRVLWWLAGHTEGLEMFHRGEDPYRDMASDIFEKPVDEIDEGNERQVGKAAVLGCGFQMAYRKFKTAAWDVYRANVTPEMAKVAVTAYRKKHWPVPELWENYTNACIAAIEKPGRAYRVGPVRFFVKNDFLWAELPSGRRLAYKDPLVEWGEVRIEGEGEIINVDLNAKGEVVATYREDDYYFQAKKIKYMAVNHKAKAVDCEIPKWTRETTYGGKLAENITQAVARDVLSGAIVRAEETGFDVLMHSHDELVSEATGGLYRLERDDKGLYCPLYREIMETPPPWAPDLPLKAGGWVGPRYKKG